MSVKTLQRWDRKGTLKANRTPTDRCYYTYDQYLHYKGVNTENDNCQIVIILENAVKPEDEQIKSGKYVKKDKK